VKNAVLLVMLSLVQGPAAAQSGGGTGELASFVASARAATARYRDQAAARADGYRRIGPDFPTMGEHWLSSSIAVRPEVDPAHPPILEYVTVSGRPVLAGVAYTQLVRDAPPQAPIPAPAAAWHFHRGSVDEESFVLSHAAAAADDRAPAGPRIAVLHAWLWLENPAGLFATDNWALPWRRLGLEPPSWIGSGSAGELAAALAAGGDRYFATLLRYREDLTPEQASRVGALLEGHRGEIRALLEETGDPSRPAEQSRLASAWLGVEEDLVRVCSSCRLVEAHGPH
jgi:hypothetical protein